MTTDADKASPLAHRAEPPTEDASDGTHPASGASAASANKPVESLSQREARALLARTRTVLFRSFGLASLAGAVIVFVFLLLVLPAPRGAPLGPPLRTNLPVFVGYLALTLVLGSVVGRRLTRRSIAWVVELRDPSPAEQRRALRLPLQQMAVAAVFWAVAVLVFTLLNTQYSGELAGRVATTVSLAGLATCALAYLLAERALRPLVVRTLMAGPPKAPVAPGVLARTLIAWALATGVPVLGIGLVAAGVLNGDTPANHRTAWSIVFLAVVALLLGAGAILLAARSISEPIQSVRGALARVEAGDTSVEVSVDDASEVGLLEAGFNRMVAGLHERERLRDLLGRHVGEAVARQALESGVALGGETRDAAVLFVDVVGSTALAEECPPETVVERLNEFFAVVQEVSERHGGWINKFEGDAALCVFGVPLPLDDMSGEALAAARELDEQLHAGPVGARIGVSAGSVVAGNVGSPERFEYTVIGDAVNEAARLTELAKQYDPPVLASEAVIERASASEAHRWKLGDTVTLRGRRNETRLAQPRSVVSDERREPAGA